MEISILWNIRIQIMLVILLKVMEISALRTEIQIIFVIYVIFFRNTLLEKYHWNHAGDICLKSKVGIMLMIRNIGETSRQRDKRPPAFANSD